MSTIQRDEAERVLEILKDENSDCGPWELKVHESPGRHPLFYHETETHWRCPLTARILPKVDGAEIKTVTVNVPEKVLKAVDESGLTLAEYVEKMLEKG
jgi:hypothetical protein